MLTCESTNGTQLRVYVIDDAILRVRYATEGYFERDFSYALDNDFQGQVGNFQVLDSADAIVLKTSKVHL